MYGPVRAMSGIEDRMERIMMNALGPRPFWGSVERLGYKNKEPERPLQCHLAPASHLTELQFL